MWRATRSMAEQVDRWAMLPSLPRTKKVELRREDIMLNISVWVLQFLLAAAFRAHGWLFLSPPATMVEQMNASINPALRIFIGVAEVLAAIGLTARPHAHHAFDGA